MGYLEGEGSGKGGPCCAPVQSSSTFQIKLFQIPADKRTMASVSLAGGLGRALCCQLWVF